MSKSLKLQTLHALFWSILERIGQQAIRLFISIILARLLLPEQFGLIAMLMVFMEIAQFFIDSGFGAALIQKQNLTYTDECSIFYFNILVSFLATALLCLVAPRIANFYNQPMLVPLTRTLSLNLIINAFALVHFSLLTKNIDFKTQLKVSILATGISGTVGITMAYNGFGIWSLVAQSLGHNLLRTILFWLLYSWRPSLVFSFNSLRVMFSFGSHLLISSLINTVFGNIYFVVIGRLFSPGDLGFYSFAEKLQKIPVTNISGIIGRVTFPVFSSVQSDKALLKRGFRKSLTTLAMITFPMMIGLLIVAEPLVHVFLSSKWLPCVPYLQLHCVAGILYPFNIMNLNVLIAMGRSDLCLRLVILTKLLVAIAVVITYRWGIIAMIYGQIASSSLAYILNAYYTGKMMDYPASRQVQDLMPGLMLSCLMGGGVYALRYAPIDSLLALLSVQIMAGTVLYTFLCYIFRISSFMEALEIVKSKLLNPRYID